jgi:hypothetical protein
VSHTSLGKVSLWTSIAGVVVPVGLAAIVLVVVLFLTPQRYRGAPKYAGEGLAALAICLVLCFILEFVALGCGIAARRTTGGKAGLAISAVILTLAIALAKFVLH